MGTISYKEQQKNKTMNDYDDTLWKCGDCGNFQDISTDVCEVCGNER